MWEILHSTIKKMNKQVSRLQKDIEEMQYKLEAHERKVRSVPLYLVFVNQGLRLDVYFGHTMITLFVFTNTKFISSCISCCFVGQRIEGFSMGDNEADNEMPTEAAIEKEEDRLKVMQSAQKNLYLIIFQASLHFYLT